MQVPLSGQPFTLLLHQGIRTHEKSASQAMLIGYNLLYARVHMLRLTALGSQPVEINLPRCRTSCRLEDGRGGSSKPSMGAEVRTLNDDHEVSSPRLLRI